MSSWKPIVHPLDGLFADGGFSTSLSTVWGHFGVQDQAYASYFGFRSMNLVVTNDAVGHYVLGTVSFVKLLRNR